MVERLLRNFLWKDDLHLVRWSKVIFPLDSGDLGLLSMRDKNMAFVSKWIWRYKLKKDALWRKLIQVKDGTTISLNWVSLLNARGPWKSIVKY